MRKLTIVGTTLAAVLTAGAWSNVASADTWRTTEADGTVVETPLKSPDEPAQDYKAGATNPSTRVNRPGNSMRVPGAKGLPEPGGPRNRKDTKGNSTIDLGTVYPGYWGYPGYYNPYPSVPYSGPLGNPYSPNPPWINVIPGPGQGYAPYPYGYPPYGYPYPAYPPAYPPYGYPYPGSYGYGSYPAGNGSYYGYNNSTQAGISLGAGGARITIGGSRTTTGSSTTTRSWP
jgi:hypothetical protein